MADNPNNNMREDIIENSDIYDDKDDIEKNKDDIISKDDIIRKKDDIISKDDIIRKKDNIISKDDNIISKEDVVQSKANNKNYIRKCISLIIQYPVKVMIVFGALVVICLIIFFVKHDPSSYNDVENVEDQTLTWYINYSWFNTTWGESLVSKEISKKTGVNIKFITPSGDNTKKLESMINSDSLSDIVTIGYWEGQVKEMLNRDMVYPLDTLADKYDKDFYNVTDKQVMDWNKQSDGHIYQYPNYVFTPKDYENKNIKIPSNETFLVRKDIYEAIGSPDMTTPSGFVSAVEKANEMFGESEDLIPVGAHEFTNVGCDSFDQYLFDFLAVPYVDKDGKAYDRFSDKSYITWLKAFRKLGSEGLLKDDIFFDKRVQMEEKIAQGRYFCMLYQRTDLANQQKILYKNSPDSIYIAIDGPKNLNGDDYVLSGSGINGWTSSFISRKCKDPKKAIKLFTFLISEEGQMLTTFGVRGKMWDYDSEGKVVVFDKVKDLLETNREVYDREYGGDATYWMLHNEVFALKLKEPQIGILRQMEEWTYPYTKYTDHYVVPLDGSTQEGKIATNVAAQWGKTLPKLLVAKSDEEFDAIYKEYNDKKKEWNYDLVLKEETRIINENKKKLGIK